MKNQNSVFIAFSLSLTAGLMFAYSSLVGYFNGHQLHEAQLLSVQNELEKEKLKSTLLAYQLQDFKQEVAQVLPSEKALTHQYPLKTLSNVVRVPASEGVDLSGALFEKGKTYFNKGQYSEAIQTFTGLLSQYPLSVHVVEARFFIAESFFLTKDYRSSLSMIDQMVALYPYHDLTGFILLRMGQISEVNNQNREALEVYRAVQKNFKNQELVVQARRLAGHAEK